MPLGVLSATCYPDGMQKSVYLIASALLAALPSHANPIELAPGLWQIDSEETQDMVSDGRIGTRAPVTSTDTRCLDEATAWLIPSDYASSFNKPGCTQNAFQSTPLDFKGEWICRVDGLDLSIQMTGIASLTGDTYSTLMTVTGRNASKSVNVRNAVSATRIGECPASGYLEAPSGEAVLRGR